MVLFNFLTGLSVEAFIIAFAAFLARPKINKNDDKSKEEIRAWNLFFNITSCVAMILLTSDILYVYTITHPH